MSEIILFYSLLGLAVGIGAAYSLYLYYRHTSKHGDNHHKGGAAAH